MEFIKRYAFKNLNCKISENGYLHIIFQLFSYVLAAIFFTTFNIQLKMLKFTRLFNFLNITLKYPSML